MTHSGQSQKAAPLPQVPESEQQYAVPLGSHCDGLPSDNGFNGPHFPSLRTNRLIADVIPIRRIKVRTLLKHI